MSATDELRSLLDEHGIEWWYDPHVSQDHTEWMTDRMAFTSLGFDGDMLTVKTISKMTPEQAIDATMGRETCQDVGFAPYLFECSECGKVHLRNAAYVDMPNYCPNCGRRVVE